MPTVYAMCANNCKYETYTREQIATILQQLIDGGSLAGIDPTLSPIVALVRETKSNADLSFWLGTEAEYNALDPAPDAALFMGRVGADGKIYFCTDDTTLQGWYDNIVQDAKTVVDEAIAASGITLDCVPLNGSLPMTGNLTYTDGENVYQYYGEHNPPPIMDLLWENASPTSAFSAQTISLDLSEYDLVYLVSGHSAEYSNWTICDLFPVGSSYCPTHVASASSVKARNLRCSNTGIIFENSKVDNNTVLIPQKIYGIK